MVSWSFDKGEDDLSTAANGDDENDQAEVAATMPLDSETALHRALLLVEMIALSSSSM